MNDRRTLLEGLKPATTVPTTGLTPEERRFAFGEQPEPAKSDARILLSTRIRADYAKALKRASLQRQLEGIRPNTLQDILEEAVEPWLRTHGFLT
jgi:hypothetical protein